MRRFGIWLETADFLKKPDFVDQVLGLVRDGIFDFVQLQLLFMPNSYDETHAIVVEKMKNVPTVIHAPIYVPPRYYGINTGDKTAFEDNVAKLKDSQKFADLLQAEIIVLHPGSGDGEEYLRETIRQFQMINDPRIAVENLPYNPSGCVLQGSSPKDIKRIIDETGCKFCFDFAHAICAANSLWRDVYDDFAKYNALQPDLYHLSDGDFSGIIDEHLHLGLGNYDTAKILKEFTPEDSMIVLETRVSNPTTADLWVKDMQYIKNLGLR
jgi:endonuclease IV